MKKHVILPLKDIVLFSEGVIQINANQDFDLALQKAIEANDNMAIGLSIKEHHEDGLYRESDFYHVGNLVEVVDIKKERNGYLLRLKTLERVKVGPFEIHGDYFLAPYEAMADIRDFDTKTEGEILDYIKKMTEEMGQHIPGSAGFVEGIKQVDDLNNMIATLMPYIPISVEEKQSLLEMTSLRKKSLRFIDIMIERKEQLAFQVELNSKFSEDMNQQYRERMLREQMKAIQEELGDMHPEKQKKDYAVLIKEKKLPEEIEDIALEELDKLSRMSSNQAEANVIRSYLDLILALPFETEAVTDINIAEAARRLDDRHYGLNKVKDRIIQHLTVMKLKKNKQGSILLLVGPPGTGKTSLASSIAKVLNREYVRISLGGVRDEAEIRGHRRTYIGAMPGRIIQGMKRAGTKNPVFVLDEIDKLVQAGHGDPSSALLEVLDPEQNHTFNDHYLDAPYDLSDVFFIATANDLRTIPGPLRDRMEIIQIGSYTAVEKFHIASRHLLSLSLEEHGLKTSDIKLSDNALKSIIDKYTREAGVRGLKRQLDKLVRVASEKIVTGKVEVPYHIRENMLHALLGHELLRVDMIGESNSPGVVTGLAWTPVGGDILFIESAFIPGKGQLLLTGQLGDVMKESARISLSLIKSRLHTFMTPKEFDALDLHIHVPAGATPKDGPSAGVTMLTTIASLVTNKPVDAKLAMTGEVSLRGAVLPVGGIKEKVIAAHRSGIRKVLLPFDNKRDLEDVPGEIKQDMSFVFVKTIDEVLIEALGIQVPAPYLGQFEVTPGDRKEIGFSINQ